jgi:hypothetical protein
VVSASDRHLDKAIASTRELVDEIVVIATGAVDRIRGTGLPDSVRLHDVSPGDDDAATWNCALERCTGDWVIWLGAHEVVRYGSPSEVRGRLAGSTASAYEVAVHARPGFTPYRDIRVFRNDPRIRFRGRVHPVIWPALDALDDGRRVAVADTRTIAIERRAFDRDHLAEHRRELSRLRAACADEPGRVFPWCHVARICAADGRSRLADEAWHSAVQAARSKPHPAAGDSIAWIGAVEWTWGRGGAPELLREALARFPRNPRLQWLDAQLALREGRLQEAAVACERLVERGRTGDFDDAIACDQRIFTSLAAAALATCHLRQGRPRQARVWFERAAAREPECVEYRVKAALCATLEGSGDRRAPRRAPGRPAVPRRRAPRAMPKPYLFIHIPRTGGVTMAAILERHERPERFAHFWVEPTPAQAAELPGKETVVGHFRYGLHRHFDRPCTYVTILREPLDRLVSHYYLQRESPRDPRHEIAVRYPIEQWAERVVDADNGQVQFIAGLTGAPTRDTLARAEKNLRAFALVGLTHRFDETVVLMKRHLGIDRAAQPRANAGRIRVDVDHVPARTREALAPYVRLDDELYRVAQELFEAQVERAGPIFHRDLERLRIEMGPCPSAPPMAAHD